MKKRFTAFALAAALCLGLAVPASAAGFSDVPAGHWAYEQINRAVADGIVGGYQDGSFRPSANVTFGQFCAFLARAFYGEEVGEAGTGPWYRPYTDVLERHGILAETALASDFAGNIEKPIIRNEMALLMYNIIKEKNVRMPSDDDFLYSATVVKEYEAYSKYPAYRFAILCCHAAKVLGGQSDGTMGGWNPMNRAQAAVVIERLKAYLAGEEAGGEVVASGTIPDGPQPLAPVSSGERTLTNGKAITEENVMELLDELRATKYPDKGTYDVSTGYYSKAIRSTGWNCAKLAFMLSDDIFGVDAPARLHTNYSSIKPGDIIAYKNEAGQIYHWIVVTTVSGSDGFYKGVGGDSSGILAWNEYGYTSRMTRGNVWTRYPD